jgi:hypothetical protein
MQIAQNDASVCECAVRLFFRCSENVDRIGRVVSRKPEKILLYYVFLSASQAARRTIKVLFRASAASSLFEHC